jgi:predicted RNase H-like HicB family nuclease
VTAIRDTTISPFTAIFLPGDRGGYCGFIAEVPGALAQGDTMEETREGLRESLDMILRYHYTMTKKELLEERRELIEEPFIAYP